ncbi:hypothetical protein [Hymenobacter fodinae]|uniref:Uncharacterized protein n=1 Tax=Hymenobacter fodinae TaxID=2510796 RepID=A0A4Z0P5W9_9BACT|nr:hypothetical protein [Hymenobacter fodinae]TGE07681.1 hypothetical protein EU556_07960 [Hymenobacter fodinae]
MPTTSQKDKGAQLIFVIAICLVASAPLPMWFKGLFVEDSGNFSIGVTGVVLLTMGMLRRWRPARSILLGLTILYLCVDVVAFTLSPDKVGFLLIGPLHLLALCLLAFSRDVRQYVEEPATTA